jgi:hypothetical protein
VRIDLAVSGKSADFAAVAAEQAVLVFVMIMNWILFLTVPTANHLMLLLSLLSSLRQNINQLIGLIVLLYD